MATDMTPKRDKHWEELDEKEKCERLRQQVKNQQRVIDRLSRMVDKLEVHLHVGKTLVVPIQSSPSGESEQNSRRTAEYF